MHNDNLKWQDMLKEYQRDPANKKMSVAGDDRTPAFTWIGYLYFDSGVVCMPSDNLMTMLREGGAKCPTGKKGATFKRQTQSGIIVDQAAWPLIGSKGAVKMADINAIKESVDFAEHEEMARELGFELFVKRAKICQNKHVRVRPRFDQWSCSGTVTVFDDEITTDVLKNILVYAGTFSGIGDWRPSSPKAPGPWGKFSSTVKMVK
jgi:hypothetical protein